MTGWTSCAKQMPPDDSTEVIAQYRDYPPIIAKGDRINDGIERCLQGYKEDTKWMIYSDAAWREVNR